MKTNTIAVIGGTGKSGRYLVQNLIAKGYSLKLLLRHPESLVIQHHLIEVVQGDARNKETIHALIEGCSVVMSTLGQPIGERSVFSDATRNIIQAMEYHGIKRYIVTTGLSVNTASDEKTEQIRMATNWMYENYPETTHDKQKEYEFLLKSSLDWTLVRLPLISLTDESYETEASLVDCKGTGISATDLAEFLTSQIKDSTYFGESPFLYNV